MGFLMDCEAAISWNKRASIRTYTFLILFSMIHQTSKQQARQQQQQKSHTEFHSDERSFRGNLHQTNNLNPVFFD